MKQSFTTMSDPFMKGNLVRLRNERKQAIKFLKKHTDLDEQKVILFVDEVMKVCISETNDWNRRMVSTNQIKSWELFE